MPWKRLLPFQLGHGQRQVLSHVAGAWGRPFSIRNPSGATYCRWNISWSPGKVWSQARHMRETEMAMVLAVSAHSSSSFFLPLIFIGACLMAVVVAGQEGAGSPVAFPGLARRSQAGLLPWLHTLASGLARPVAPQGASCCAF